MFEIVHFLNSKSISLLETKNVPPYYFLVIDTTLASDHLLEKINNKDLNNHNN